MKKFTLLFAAILAVSMSFATTVTKTVESLATELSWTNGTVCTPFALDNAITVSTTATDANTGKYYSNGQQIRLYQTGSATITLTAGEGYSISSVALTYVSQNTGILLDATGAAYESGTDFAVNAQTVTFSVGNSGEATNGQARVTEFSVTYIGAGADTTSQDTTPVVPPVEMETLLFNANIWNVTDVNEKYAAWVWGNNLQGQWTDFFTPVDAENTYGVQIPVTADSIVFVRLDNAIDTVTWNNIWNQTLDYAINHADLYFTVEGWGEGENAKSYGTWGTPVVYNTCADVNAVTANTNMTLGEVTVVFAKGSYIYVKDETATTLVYTNNYSTLQAGDRVSGIAGQAKLYNGLPELAPTTAIEDLTIVPGEAPVIFDAQAAPTVANVNEVMMFRGVQMPAASFTTSRASNITGIFAGEEVAFRNNWKEAYDFDSTKTYSMLGCVAIYNGAIQVYVTNIEEEVAPVQNYYIKNNWDGASDWTWVEMNPVMNNVIYEYTGVFGGTGVNINTTASDEGSTWFPVENFSVLDSTFVPQALDTLHFVYSIVDSVLAVELVGRPAPAPVQYYIKNNWNGAADWTWAEMNMLIDNVLYEYTGVFGGSGVNINTTAADEGSTWFSVENFSVLDSTFVPQASDTLHFVYSIVDSVLAVELVGRPAADTLHHYYIKNNWNGGADWGWVEMNMVMDNVLYEYTGVFGGSGVNINTAAADEGSTWFSVENFSVLDSTFVPQALDTLHFVYSIVDSVLAVELVGRPAPAPVQYYIKNNWNGAADWSWVEMNMVMDNVLYEYTGVFGGTGVNINTAASDEGSTWFSVENFSVLDSTFVPQALDTLHFVYSIVDSVLAVELVGRPAPAPEVFQIKNNWNGGEWTWVDMTPVEGQENIYEYTGVFGGTGVNITSNYMNSELWFPVDSFLVNEGDLVPQAMDTVLFAYNSVENEVGAMVLGRPEPVILDSVSVVLNITDLTGWATLNVYAWGGAEIFGAWPGMIVPENGIITIEGAYAGMTENLIFNNGQGTQLADLAIAMVDTTYEIIVRLDGAYFADQLPTTNTCAEVNAITEATNMTLGEVTVVFAKGSNIYVQDATATTLVYTNKYADLVPGDRVQGIAGQAKLYYGLPELAATTEFADLVVTAGQAPSIPDAKTAPTMADINKVMMFRNVTMLDSAFTTPNNKAMNINGIFNGDTVTFRNNWKDTYTFEQGKTYTMLGCVAVYNNAIQVYVTNIEEYVEVPVQYYIKNNWNRGADWTWMDMIPADDGNLTWMYTGIFGGTGVNINTAATDENALWFPIDAMIIPEGNEAPEAGDSVMFVYNTVDKTVTATVLSQVIPGEDITVTFFVRDENTIWEDLYVYAWGAAEAFGAWNGYQVNQEENIIVGGEYNYRFTLTGDYEGLTLNLIFNDGIGGGEGHQFADLAIEDMQDGDEYFIIVTDEKAYFEGGDGLEEVVSNAKNETTKVIMNGQLYIIRDGKVYNALGAQVR